MGLQAIGRLATVLSLLAVATCATPGSVCPAVPPNNPTPAAAITEPSVPAPQNEDEKVLYTVGQMIGGNVVVYDLDARELTLVVAGMTDRVLKRQARVDPAVYGSKVDALASSRKKALAVVQDAAGKSFRKKAAQETGATTLPSGVIVRKLRSGTGSSPPPSARVSVHYEGKLISGEVFDSSRRRGEPVNVPLSGVISCWNEGFGRMNVGDKVLLVCPPETAYGEQGRPPAIPGQATLIFEVELLGFDP